MAQIIKYIVALCIGALVIWLLYPRKVVEKVPVEIEKIVRIEVDNATKKIRDKGGVQHAIVDDKINLVKSVTVLDTSSRVQLKRVTDQLGIKEKQLKEYLSYTASLEGRLKHATKVNDTTYIRDDGNMKIEFVHKDTSSYFNYKYDAKVNYARYKNRVDFWIDDPKVTINGVKKLSIQTNKKFGIKAGGSAFLIRDNAYLGGSADVKIGRNVISGGYYYDVTRNEWLPVFGYKFNIIDL